MTASAQHSVSPRLCVDSNRRSKRANRQSTCWEKRHLKMQEILVTLFLVLFTGCLFHGINSKENLESPFRLSKHNLLWERAKESLGKSPKLDTLYKELKKLDKLSLTWKHLENKDREDARQLAVDTKEMYLDILNRYSLLSNRAASDGLQYTKPKFSQEVEKLWQEAVSSGKFSHDELESLEKEFKHHEKKIEEYRSLADKLIGHDSISDNDIRSFDKMSDDELKKLKKDIKSTHNNVSIQFLDLKKKVKRKAEDIEDDFTDSRVVELWDLAQAKRFSKEELESIKVELKHFQIRIDKHEYWKERERKLGQEINEGHITDKMDHGDIMDKIKEHRKLVKKYHATMLDRVHKRDEL